MERKRRRSGVRGIEGLILGSDLRLFVNKPVHRGVHDRSYSVMHVWTLDQPEESSLCRCCLSVCLVVQKLST